MASGLYSQHLNNRKLFYIRQAVLVVVLILFAVVSLFPSCI